jgi:hypothetical protein
MSWSDYSGRTTRPVEQSASSKLPEDDWVLGGCKSPAFSEKPGFCSGKDCWPRAEHLSKINSAIRS